MLWRLIPNVESSAFGISYQILKGGDVATTSPSHKDDLFEVQNTALCFLFISAAFRVFCDVFWGHIQWAMPSVQDFLCSPHAESDASTPRLQNRCTVASDRSNNNTRSFICCANAWILADQSHREFRNIVSIQLARNAARSTWTSSRNLSCWELNALRALKEDKQHKLQQATREPTVKNQVLIILTNSDVSLIVDNNRAAAWRANQINGKQTSVKRVFILSDAV